MKRTGNFGKKALLCGLLWVGGGLSPLLAGEPFTIRGEVRNIPDSVVLVLLGPEQARLTYDTLKNGRFVFTGEVEKPEKLFIYTPSAGFPPVGLDVWVAPGASVAVTGSDKLMKTWDVVSDIPEQVDENRYADACRNYLIELQKSAMGLSVPGLKKAGADSVIRVLDSVQHLIYQAEVRLLQQLPVTLQWIRKMSDHASRSRMSKSYAFREDLLPLYDRMSEQQQQTPQGKTIAFNLWPPKIVQAGDDLADGDLFDPQGKKCRLADFKGRYQLLDFWSAGCGPCRKAIPEMKEIAAKYGDKIAVISISLDEEQLWKKASAELGVDGINLNDFKSFTGLAAWYGVKGIPHYVLISPEGKVITGWAGYGPGSLKEKLAEMAPETFPAAK